MKPSGSAAKSAIASVFSTISSLVNPEANPPKIILSRPESAGLKPTPKARSVEIFPLTIIRPSVGGKIPAIERINVDLPAPFAPTMPKTEPWATSRVRCLTASTVRMRTFSPLLARITAFFKVRLVSTLILYLIERSSMRIANSSGITTGALDSDRKVTLP